MANNMKDILSKLGIEGDGNYVNKFYVVDLQDSNDYARMYTTLCNNAINTEYPSMESNTNNTTKKITNYFEVDDEGETYNIFLIADFAEDKYVVKIGAK